MPNYCYNELYITGKADDVQAWIDWNETRQRQRVTEKEQLINQYGEPETWYSTLPFEVYDKLRVPREEIIDFNDYVPYPNELPYNKGGYEWCIKNWGTKWNAIEPRLTEDEKYYKYTEEDIGEPIDEWQTRKVIIDFTTAWSPPTPVVIAMSRQFPKLVFELRFEEQGMQFQGVFVAEAGEIKADAEWTYHGTMGG